MQVCCRACGDILTYEKNDTNPLIQHIRTKHPEKNLVCLPAVYSQQDATEPEPRNSKSTKKKEKNADQNESEPDTDELPTCPSNMNFTGSKYKYTVKYYGHSKECIKCPECNTDMYPILKQKTNRTLPSLIRALFYLICWPINFLPFLLCGNKEYNLYCSKCQKKIGSQDKKGEVVLTSGKNGGGEDDDKDDAGEGEKQEEEPEKENEDKSNKKTKSDKTDKTDKKQLKEKSSKESAGDDQTSERMVVTELKDKELKDKELKDKERVSKEKGKGKTRKGKSTVKHPENFDSSISSVPLGRILGRKSGKVFR